MLKWRSRRLSTGPWAVVLAADVTGLSAVRCLRRAGVRTIAVTLDPRQPVLWSRYPVKHVVPTGLDQDAALLDTLRGIDMDVAPAVVIPTSDIFVSFLSRHRDDLSARYVLCIPSDELVTLFNDKALETRRLAELGIPMPRSVQELPDDPDALIASLGLPLIIKPKTAVDAARLGLKAVPLTERDAVRAFHDAHRPELANLIAQELIVGDGPTQWVCNCTFDAAHHLVSAFTFRKLSTSPPQYGVTCHGRVEPNDEIVEIARRIGLEVGYTGAADLDFKYEEATGTYKFLELNPRLGMCNALGTRGGVNCPADAYQIALGQPVEPTVARPGVEYFNALDELYGRLHTREHSWRELARGLVAVVRVLARRPVCPCWSWTDPLPVLVIFGRTLRARAANRMRRVRRLSKNQPARPVLSGKNASS